MELFVLWFGTTVISFGMEIANELRMFKDIADAGYKVDIEKMANMNKTLDATSLKVICLSLLIPVFNMMKVIERTMQYNNARHMIVDQLNIAGVLEKMTDEEKEEYAKNKTALNAIMLTMNQALNLENAKSIKYYDGICDNEIFYKIENSDITILKTTGRVARLSVEEQKKRVIESIIKEAQEKYPKDLVTNMNANSQSSVEPDVSFINSLNADEQKQLLEVLKSDLLNTKESTQQETSISPVLKKVKEKQK